MGKLPGCAQTAKGKQRAERIHGHVQPRDAEELHGLQRECDRVTFDSLHLVLSGPFRKALAMLDIEFELRLLPLKEKRGRCFWLRCRDADQSGASKAGNGCEMKECLFW